MYALILVTAMFVGEHQGATSKTCIYRAPSGNTHTLTVDYSRPCPLTIEVND